MDWTPFLTPLCGVAIAIIGWMCKRILASVDAKLDALPLLQTEVELVKKTQSYHSERLNDFCERLEHVESSVSNTERIAVMENAVRTVQEEVKGLRSDRHEVLNKINELGLKLASGQS
jgi:hypothetical protein